MAQGEHLAQRWLRQLRQLRGIQSRLREFEAAEPAAAAVAQSLRAMVERFDMKRYMMTIGDLREIA